MFHDQDSAHQIKQHRSNGCQRAQQHKEPSACHPLPNVQTDHPPVCLLVSGVFRFFPAEQLHQQLAADGERLIQNPVDFIIAGLRLPRQFPSGLPGHACRQREQGHNDDSHQRQNPVLLEHGNHRHRQGNQIGQNAGERSCDHGFHAGDIAGHPGNDIPLISGCEEPLTHLLQMAVHLISHVIGDMLSDPAVQIGFPYPDQIRHQMQREGQQDQLDKSAQPFSEPSAQIPSDQHVDHISCQDGRKQPAYGGNQNAAQHQCQLLPVRFQVGKDSYQQLLCHFRGILFLFLSQIAGPSSRASGSRHVSSPLFVFLSLGIKLFKVLPIVAERREIALAAVAAAAAGQELRVHSRISAADSI